MRYEGLTREELSRAVDEKDGIIQKQTLDISGLEQQLAHIRSRNQELHDRVNDLSYQLEEEKR